MGTRCLRTRSPLGRVLSSKVSPTGSGSRENAFTASYRAEWAHFEAAVAGEAKAPSLQEHVVLHRILDAVYKSAQEGRDITL